MGTRTDTDGRRNKKKKSLNISPIHEKKVLFWNSRRMGEKKKKGIAFFYDSAADWSDIEWVRYA